MVKKGADEDFLVQKSLTLWPPKFTVRSERNVLPSSFSCFLFFLSHVYLSGKTPVSCLAWATPVSHKERRASVALICLLFERRDVYPRQTMRQLRKVCHAEGVLCLSSWQQSWTNPAIADEAFLARCWSGRLPQPGKAKSLLRKTRQTYRQGYKPQRLYK